MASSYKKSEASRTLDSGFLGMSVIGGWEMPH